MRARGTERDTGAREKGPQQQMGEGVHLGNLGSMASGVILRRGSVCRVDKSTVRYRDDRTVAI